MPNPVALWISAGTSQRCSCGECAELHWMKSSHVPCQLSDPLSRCFVSSWQLDQSGNTRTPRWIPNRCSYQSFLARAQIFGGISACSEMFTFLFIDIIYYSPLTGLFFAVQIILSGPLQLSYWNITAHSSNRPGSLIWSHTFHNLPVKLQLKSIP